jgi:hypothetical protein
MRFAVHFECHHLFHGSPLVQFKRAMARSSARRVITLDTARRYSAEAR